MREFTKDQHLSLSFPVGISGVWSVGTTFNVIYLGTVADIDPTEGNGTSEDAGILVGSSFGSAADPIGSHIQSLSPGSTGYGAGDPSYYDTNNAGDTFSLDGGPDQVFDNTVGYNATITYTDGTTATITAVVFQDTAGRLYLAPEVVANADQVALDAKPIESILFTSTNGTTNTGLYHDRDPGNFQAPICFEAATRILTPNGEVPAGQLRPGDLVCTADNGAQLVIWTGGQVLGPKDLLRRPNACPVLVPETVLGARRPLLVSQQHALAVGNRLIRARHLCDVPGSGARVARGKRQVSYVRLLFEQHQIVFADGVPAESLYPGPLAIRALGVAARRRFAGLSDAFRDLSLGRGRVEDLFGPRARPLVRRRDLSGFQPI